VMSVRSQNRYLGWTFAGLWFLGWVSLAIFVSSFASDFRRQDRIEQVVPLTQPAGGRMLIRVDEPEVMYTGSFGWFDNDGEGWDITEDSLKISNVHFAFNKSNDSLYHVTILKESRGRNRSDARQRAERIVYNGASIDSALVLGSGYAISKNQKFRDQEVLVEIRVPVGKRIRFDESVREKLNPYNIRIRDERGWGRRGVDIDFDEYDYFEWKPAVDYIMTDRGQLIEADSATLNPDGTYEYKPATTDTARLIEEQKRKVEEEQRKLQELENQKTNTNTTKAAEPAKLRVKSDMSHFQVPSPVFSLII
jgi:hypothetical protein